MSTSGPAIPVPLDESWTSWWHQANRVVFQRGIELRKTTRWGDSPYWEVIGKSGRVTVSLEEFCKQVALAPVLLGIENQEYSRTFLVPSNAGLVLEMALQQLQTHLPSSALL